MLTTAQLQTLKTLAQADGTAAGYITNGQDQALADWLNAATDPAFVCWRTSVSVEEYREAVTWTEVDALTAGKARIWEWLTGRMTLPLDASKGNVRQGLADCWASNSATRPALLAIAKRTATRAEAALATGTGSDASPGTFTYEGALSAADASLVRVA